MNLRDVHLGPELNVVTYLIACEYSAEKCWTLANRKTKDHIWMISSFQKSVILSTRKSRNLRMHTKIIGIILEIDDLTECQDQCCHSPPI